MAFKDKLAPRDIRTHQMLDDYLITTYCCREEIEKLVLPKQGCPTVA